jgi:hypothetical protein
VVEEEEWYRKLEETTATTETTSQKERGLLAWGVEEAARSSSCR